jgi:predicted O-methyltransferase YrrM
MNIVEPAIEQFLHALQRSEDAVLLEMEARGERERFPIIGPLVGRLCQQIALTIGARDVFEMGSGFGYSTYFFAQAVGDGGRVVHTDGDAKLSADARGYLTQAGLAPRVHFEVGDALKLIAKYPGPFDIVFIDVEKHQYPAALELARSRVRDGGYIITDNVLWSGRVTKPAAEQDENTRAVVKYVETAFAAPELHTVIVPIRDGVALSYRLPGGARGRKR